MKTRNVVWYMCWVFLPLLFWQCVESTGKELEDETVEEGYVRRFNTRRVSPESMQRILNITGRVVPLQQINVVAQVQGIALPISKPFKTGTTFRKGQTLVAIDDTEFRSNLTAQKSQFLSSLVRIMSDLKLDYSDDFHDWNSYLDKLDITKTLHELPEVDNKQLRYFLAANDIYNLFYNIRSKEETLGKYRIKAPFDGAVTSAKVDVGNLVSPGAGLGSFIRTDKYEVQTAVSTSDIDLIRLGQKIRLTSSDNPTVWEGEVSRIGKSVDQRTQAVSVYLEVNGLGIREGMYLEGQLLVGSYDHVVELPKNLLTRQNQVHTLVNGTVQLKDVKPVEFYESTVVVEGLTEGEELILDPGQSPIQG
ncbi:MAG: HlyD family efflux transporter periplasmic adaptor subunit, partial [Cyclobacteriaceae bacterium]|nr:HlyD family efflux transporter periplasmic adaptor subunit [Cyclobacteriaceae bacterium HetDA_MAG_MS6]